MKKIIVSAAIIARENPLSGKKEIFATERGYGDWKGWWEFPGGKIENDESPKQCVEREIFEELDTKVNVKKFLGVVEYDYPDFHLTMHCFLCSVESGELKLLEHASSRWLDAESLRSVKWLPADEIMLERIARECLSV